MDWACGAYSRVRAAAQTAFTLAHELGQFLWCPWQVGEKMV